MSIDPSTPSGNTPASTDPVTVTEELKRPIEDTRETMAALTERMEQLSAQMKTFKETEHRLTTTKGEIGDT